MVLFLLQPIPGSGVQSGNFEIYGFVIRTRNEKQARELASKEASCLEWLNDKYTSCRKIETAGVIEVILSAYHGG
jgi:hypothetical protein